MLEGTIVDLVPYGDRVKDLDYGWLNNESSFWGAGGDRRFVSRAAHNTRWEQWIESPDRDRSAEIGFAIQTKAGQIIGYVGVTWLNHTHRLALLGEKIGDPAYWSRGYGSDALMLLTDYVFDWLDMRKAWALTTSMNARVMRMMEKLGYTFEGRNREGTLADGQRFDWLYYGILREEWPGYAVKAAELGFTGRTE
ncbi:MAG: GNAT family N-acetyltransferase [Anaerolineae bacterium]|nr:GNAT family N-acetyltransferase [Anaerolineae bacterium]